MRRIPLALAPLLVLLAAPGSPAGTAPVGDSGFGAGHVLETDFVSSGHSGPNGEDPVGTITLRGYLDFRATATCSNVAGNAVVAGYRIETGRRAGKGFISSAVDRGEAAEGAAGGPDRLQRHPAAPAARLPVAGRSAAAADVQHRRRPVHARRLHARRRARAAPRRRPEGAGHGLPGRRKAYRAAPPGAAVRRAGHGPAQVQPRVEPVRARPAVGERASWGDELRQGAACSTHLVQRPLGRDPGGRRYRLTVRARTTGQRWSERVVRPLDLR